MIYLHGSLAEQYGPSFDIQVRNAVEAVSALSAQLKGFKKAVLEGEWHIKRGDFLLDEESLFLEAGKHDIHFIPVPVGSKSKGLGKVILGAVLIAVAVFTAGAAVGGVGALFSSGVSTGAVFASTSVFGIASASTVAMLGGAILLGGISNLLTPVPSVDAYEGNEGSDIERNGVLRGRGNTVQPGQAVQLVYGRIRTGSQIINVGFRSENLLIEDALEPNRWQDYAMTAGSGDTFFEGDNTAYASVGFRQKVCIIRTNGTYDLCTVPIGTLSGSAEFRRVEIVRIQQWYNPDDFTYYLRVTLRGYERPRWNWFEEIKISNLSGRVVGSLVVNKNTADNACKYTPKENSLRNGDPSPSGLFIPLTSWQWPVGASPFLVDGNDYAVEMGYQAPNP